LSKELKEEQKHGLWIFGRKASQQEERVCSRALRQGTPTEARRPTQKEEGASISEIGRR
jgi:hypothetical protein